MPDGFLVSLCSNRSMNPNSNKPRTLKVELAGDLFYCKTYPRFASKDMADFGFQSYRTPYNQGSDKKAYK
jgi:hypothetical protein